MIAMIAGLLLMIYIRVRDAHRLHLVRRHRNRGNIFDRLRDVAILERTTNDRTNRLTAESDKDGLKRELGVWSAAAIVVGTVIGSGIFLVPSVMARNVGSPWKVFVVWIAGGLLSLFGALSYAELAAAMPEAGGEYVYLREAYGPLWGFLYGWTQMWVAKSGSIATLATGFFIYLANFRPELGQVWIVMPLPLGDGGSPLPIRYGQLLAIGVIALLALINYFGVRVGGDVQVATTLLKVGLSRPLL